MKDIIYNKDNLKESDINNVIKRAKIIVENSNNEVLLCYSHNNYQLPGGHVEDDESFDECVVREVKEEVGIEIPLEKRNPFISIIYMNKDYPKEGINSKYIANYYSIKSDLKPNLDNIDLTVEEKNGNFELRYINKNNVLNELNNSLNICTKENVVKDTIEVVKEYLKNNTK